MVAGNILPQEIIKENGQGNKEEGIKNLRTGPTTQI